MKKFSKTESQEKVNEFFKNIESKTPKEIKKIKKVAMGQKISLKKFRKEFCKKCLVPYSGKEKVRINHGIKSITCEKCGNISRWKMKLN
jgi:RNase P subunit RPR2